MIIDCISDLHGHYPKLEGGDLLIVAGDLTARDTWDEHEFFFQWMLNQKYAKKVFIAGNHDNYLKDCEAEAYKNIKGPGVDYLCDSGTEFEYDDFNEPEYFSDAREAVVDGPLFFKKKKIKIWGSPWTKTFPGMNPHCKAFTCDTEEELAEKWALIPDDVDILVTHSPPHGCYFDEDRNGNMLGSISLRNRILQLNLKLHVFGHIHEGYGIHPIIGQPNCVNASYLNECYEPINKPIRIEL